MIAIGFTGLSGCGKDVAASILADIAKAHNFSVVFYQFADVIRDELKKRKISNETGSREILLNLGNELRSTYGPGVLASRIIDNFKASIADNKPVPNILIATGIRNKGEVETLRKEWGENFILVSIQASENIRADRKMSRSQYQEDKHSSDEIEKADKDIGILECIEISDVQIRNDGTLDDLKDEMTQFFQNRLLPALSSQTP